MCWELTERALRGLMRKVCGHAPEHWGIRLSDGRGGLFAPSSLHPPPQHSCFGGQQSPRWPTLGLLGVCERGRCPRVSWLLGGRKGLRTKPLNFISASSKGEFRAPRSGEALHSNTLLTHKSKSVPALAPKRTASSPRACHSQSC